MNREGPTLAEEEMLHDGEPVFAMAWPEAEPRALSVDRPAAPGADQ